MYNGMRISNWAGTNTFFIPKIYRPTSESEIIQIVRHAYQNGIPLKVMGKGNSYNNNFQPDSQGHLISLEKFNDIEEINTENRTVTFKAGASTKELLKTLLAYNLTLSNLGTNIGDNYVGACSTGYHGSGIKYGIQSTNIISFEIITPQGEKKIITRDHPDFYALGVGLGIFGIIIRMTIECSPIYKLHEQTFKMTFSQAENYYRELVESSEHCKITWWPNSTIFQICVIKKTTKKKSSFLKLIKNKIIDEILIENILQEFLLYPTYFNHTLIPKVNHFIANMLVRNNHEKIFKNTTIFALYHLAKQAAIEYAIPIQDTFRLIHDYNSALESNKFYVHTPVEIRFVKKDNFWLSPAFERDSCFINTKIRLPFGLPLPDYHTQFNAIARIFETYKGRPHWGKYIGSSPGYLESVYPKWAEFWNLVDTWDPKHLFHNDYVRSIRNL